MILNLSGYTSRSSLPSLTYTGRWDLVDEGVVDGVRNWSAFLYSSGVLVADKAVNMDVFCVGGGGGGDGMAQFGHGGGGGGYTATLRNVRVNAHTENTVCIGAGGSGVTASGGEPTDGGTTSALGCTAEGGKKGERNRKGGAGGSGGGAGSTGSIAGVGGNDGSSGGSDASTNYVGGTGQGSSTRAFGETDGALYAGGGGGGTWLSGATPASGGAGAGTGGVRDTKRASDATPNTGGGGGGGGGNTSIGTGGAGGSGIVIIRNARGV